MNRYYLVNNVYATFLSDLDIEIKSTTNTSYYINGGNLGGIVKSNNGTKLLTYYIYNMGSSALCISYDCPESGNSESTRLLVSKICQEETGRSSGYPQCPYTMYGY